MITVIIMTLLTIPGVVWLWLRITGCISGLGKVSDSEQKYLASILILNSIALGMSVLNLIRAIQQ